MTASARILPFRPLPQWDDGHPPTLMDLLEAAEGLPDATVARLIDRYFPGVWNPSWCAALIDAYQDAIGDLPTDAEIDASNAAAVIRRRAWRELNEGSGL